MKREPGASDDVPSIDETPLEVLASEPGGRETLIELIALFASDMPRRLGELRQALAARDVQRASRWAHSIKGGAMTMGAIGLARLAEQIEQPRHAIADEAFNESLMADLDTEFARARDALLKFATRLNA